MNKKEIFKLLTDCIHETSIYKGTIYYHHKLKEDLAYDSLMMALLIEELENKFQIYFDIANLSLIQLKTVKDVLLLIERTIKNEVL